MKVYQKITDLIGGTPLLELTNLEAEDGLPAKIYGKLEYFNPAGSVKDRIAKGMIDDAEAKGLLKPGSVIIEPTTRQYRNWSGFHCGSQRLSSDYCNAGNHER